MAPTTGSGWTLSWLWTSPGGYSQSACSPPVIGASTPAPLPVTPAPPPVTPATPTTAAAVAAHPDPEPTYTPLPENIRLRRQLTLMVAGPVFLCASLLVTRRALRRRYLATAPAHFHSNQHPPVGPPPSGATEALEALNLATLNITAAAMTLVGGTLFALDVCTIEELRRRFRDEDGLGGELLGEGWKEIKRKEKEAEEEFEEWMVNVLARKEVKERALRRAQENQS